MELISLNDTVCKAYSSVNSSTIGIKSSIINCCAEISRFLRINFSIELSDKVDEEKFKEILMTYPKLNCLTLEQFNKFLILIVNIRNVNAHVHLKKKILINKDIVDALSSVFKPLYKVHKKGELTVYGQAYLLNFISNKYHIFPFVTTFYKNWFEEMSNRAGEVRSHFHCNHQHLLQNFCGIGKPINNFESNNNLSLSINFLFRKHLTEIIYSIEKESSTSNKTYFYTRSLSLLMHQNESLEDDCEEKDSLILLRNCWFHGIYLNDEIEYKENTIKMDFETVFKILLDIKEYLNRSHLEFKETLKIINNFATTAFCFYAARIVEVTYKLLDKRLLTKDKIEHRLDNSSFAFKTLYSGIPFIEQACALLDGNILNIEIRASKFTDEKTRKTKTETLKIIKLHSDDGFKIGEYFTDRKDIVLALVELKTEFQNKINGQYLSDYILNIEEIFGRVSVYEAIA